MKKKWMPYFFLSILMLLLFFILGFRYGQNVEKTNKAIEFLISIPPTFTPNPTQKPLEFNEYAHTFCGIRFLYPTQLSVTREGTSGAMLSEKETAMISFDCEITPTFIPDDKKTAEITFQGKKIQALFQNNTYQFVVANPKNNKKITFSIQKRVFPLLDTSIQFLSK